MSISKIKEIEKAYGGCHLCYGKGYATVRYGLRASGDFEGDKDYVDPIKTHIKYCSCSRGKQLKEQILSLIEELEGKKKGKEK